MWVGGWARGYMWQAGGGCLVTRHQQKRQGALCVGAASVTADDLRLVRYCPECGHIGDVGAPAINCCPDAFPLFVPIVVAQQASFWMRDDEDAT